METTVNNGMCRCCASEGAFKDVKSTYHWMGEEEIYSDMLQECFDIHLKVSEHGEDGGICEVCITQLRNAINFKKQVLHTEEQFKKHLQNKTLFRPNIVKVEVEGEDDSDDNMGSGDEGFSGAEFEVPIKTEDDEPKPKRRATAKAMSTRATSATTRAKKAKVDDGETSTKRKPQAVTIKIKQEVKRPDDVKHGKIIPMKIYQAKPIKNELTENLEVKNPWDSEEISKHKINITEIMLWSNATPIRRCGDMGYMCCYCEDYYLEPADLKKHTLQVHEDVTKAYFIKNMSMYQYVIKLDITGLRCKICDGSMDTTEELMYHLKDDHKKIIYTDIKNHIVPFKFTTKTLECFICMNVFNKFKQLMIHMNIHHRNYICEFCDAGFVNYIGLKYHKNTHKKGTFDCEFCPKKFDTLVKKTQHTKRVHILKGNLHRCGYCSESFNDYRRKEAHLISAHGKEMQTSKCRACDKVFKTRKHLAVHVKRDHLMERRHGCKICDMKFFSSKTLRDHMVKHSGLRTHLCKVCLKTFSRSTTLREHMRIHNDDKRFKCEHCGQAFVQKCSWRGHMKSKHGEIV